MPRLLVVRSASFQQLDKNLGAIRERFAAHDLFLLTHEHGRVLAEKYGEFRRVLIYPGSRPFTAKAPVPDLEGERFDDVLVLVSNLSGCGFANVFAFARGLPAARLHVCTLAGEIRELSGPGLREIGRRHRMSQAAAWTLGPLLGTGAVLWCLAAISLCRLPGHRR